MAGVEGWWFETSLFENAPALEEEVNPGRYGKLLASWLATELRNRGWDVQDVVAEDWGWRVRLQRDGVPLVVNCGNEDGSLTRWSVQPEANTGLLRRLFSRAATSPASALSALDGELGLIIKSDTRTTWSGREQPL